MNLSDIKINCRFFRGDVPCKPHKNYGVHCVESDGTDCIHYLPSEGKILIIKLGAVGDVIRSSPILYPLKAAYPKAKIYWLTHSPSVVPKEVDQIVRFNTEGITLLRSLNFDYAVNLDKDKEACALLNIITSKVKKGYILNNGAPYPADADAEEKYFTGLFDDVNKANTKNYLEEIFQICGFNYTGEKYILSPFDEYKDCWSLDRQKKIIGLNTGCGGRWTSRLWKDEYWIELANKLLAMNYEVVFLGGEQEDEKNRGFAHQTGGKYLGHFPLEKFINLVNQTDLVVTGVTMAMHITLGLNKKIVLFNNIFNANEFELFGLGEIIEPSKPCKCFYSPKCINPEYSCMDYISIERVIETINNLLVNK